MATYIELKNQAEALLAEAELVRKQEIAEVIQRIKAQMKEYGVTLADLGASNSGVQRKAAKTNPLRPPSTVAPMESCGRAVWAASLNGCGPCWLKARTSKIT